jgi:hypothetical protein
MTRRIETLLHEGEPMVTPISELVNAARELVRDVTMLAATLAPIVYWLVR